MIKAVIFDFDGVILESAGIKTAAFRRLFEKDHPDKADDIVEYHKKNMGISRYVKFGHIYKNILKKPLSRSVERLLGEKFSEIVFDEILSAPFVCGAGEFIKERCRDYDLFIASGTPLPELMKIIKKRRLTGYFKEIHGSPEEKKIIIDCIMKKYGYARSETVFIGDAESDRIAAEENYINFILRLTDENEDIAAKCSRKIPDLSSLSCLLKKMKE